MFYKSLMTATLAALSVTAFACPDLTGTYECTYDGQVETMDLTQYVADGVTHFKVGQTEVVADGASHPMPDSQPEEQATYTASCNGNVLGISFFSLLIDNANKIGQISGQQNMSLDNVGDLVQDIKGTLVIDAQGTFPIDEVTTCRRI